jgi:sec-independent protein translocase protein TatC
MTFWEHLEELRRRLIYSVIAILVCSIGVWFFREEILGWLTHPFVRAWSASSFGTKAQLHFPSPAALFIAYLKIAGLGGVILSLPVTLFQIWGFVAPGLYSTERKLVLPLVVGSCVLFAIGAGFAWGVVSPLAFEYLLGFGGQLGNTELVVVPTVMVDEYIGFVTQMLLAFGVTFQLPVVIFFLASAGIVRHTHLIRFARYFVVVAFAISAVLSQFLLAVPLCILYAVSIGLAYFVGRRRETKAPTE